MKGISNILPSFTRTVLCVLCALGLSLGAYAQSRTATVNVKDVTVKELLKAIEAGSSYTFAYVDTDIDLAGKVSVTAKNEDIEAILKKVLPGVKVEFKDQKILLSKKAPEARPKASGTVGPKIITGKVVDKSGQPVIGAMVIELLGRIPEDGEKPSVQWENVKFTVTDAEDGRIMKIRAELTENK